MMKSRQTAILLLGALALAQLTACGNEANTGTKETQAKGQDNAPVTEAVTEVQGEPDDLPDTDLNGYNFRMLAFMERITRLSTRRSTRRVSLLLALIKIL